MNHAPSIDIISWQRSEHVTYHFCLEHAPSVAFFLMTTDSALLYIPKVWSMLRQLSSSNDNGQSMVKSHSCMKHATSVAIFTWQRSEHGNISLWYESCSVSCHHLITTVLARLYIIYVWNMLRQLFSPYKNVQSMVLHPWGYKSCSVICHRLMPSVREWWYIPQVWNMLRQWSSSYDRGRSMVIYHSSMKQAPFVVSVSWQRSEHGDTFLGYEACSLSCHRHMTTVRAW